MCSKSNSAELDAAFRLDEYLLLPPAHDEFLSSLTNDILDHTGTRKTKDSTKKTQITVSILLANLLRARGVAVEVETQDETGAPEVVTQGGWLSISRNSNDYKNTRYTNPDLSYRAVERVLSYLTSEEGLIRIEEVGGFLDREKGRGRKARVRLDTKSYDLFTKREEREEDKTLNPNLNKIPIITNYTSFFPSSLLIRDTDLEVIRLKDENKKLIDYPDTPEVVAMRERLREWNNFSLAHWPDIFLTNHEFLSLQGIEVDVDAGEAFRSAGERHTRPIDLTRRVLYRVFNNRLWRHGGRLYGGWWQYVPSRFRNRITINTRPTALVHRTTEASFTLPDFLNWRER